jgi:hypothetical protein
MVEWDQNGLRETGWRGGVYIGFNWLRIGAGGKLL